MDTRAQNPCSAGSVSWLALWDPTPSLLQSAWPPGDPSSPLSMGWTQALPLTMWGAASQMTVGSGARKTHRLQAGGHLEHRKGGNRQRVAERSGVRKSGVSNQGGWQLPPPSSPVPCTAHPLSLSWSTPSYLLHPNKALAALASHWPLGDPRPAQKRQSSCWMIHFRVFITFDLCSPQMQTSKHLDGLGKFMCPFLTGQLFLLSSV